MERTDGEDARVGGYHREQAMYTPGQAAAVYREDHLVGGGWIV